jgi:DNA-directed RNA polymerase sigma subunit (sigma70/sigma32)
MSVYLELSKALGLDKFPKEVHGYIRLVLKAFELEGMKAKNFHRHFDHNSLAEVIDNVLEDYEEHKRQIICYRHGIKTEDGQQYTYEAISCMLNELHNYPKITRARVQGIEHKVLNSLRKNPEFLALKITK